ncbi:MAG: hypothetical protein ACOYYS_18740 [Chloroflexota bacterium]
MNLPSSRTPRRGAAAARTLQQTGIPALLVEDDLDRAAESLQGCWLEKAIPTNKPRRRQMVGCYREDHANRRAPDALPATIYVEVWQHPEHLVLERYLELPTYRHVPKVQRTRHKSYAEARLAALRWLGQARKQMRQAGKPGGE